MQFIVSGRSVIGRIRRKNEDNFSIDNYTLSVSHGDTSLITKTLKRTSSHLLGVYDGMGGHLDGEIASYIMATEAKNHFARLTKTQDITKALIDLCMHANDEVCKEADGSRMGTTCALLCLTGDEYTVCNVGDSPVFLIRNGLLTQISVDHNEKSTYEKITGKTAHPEQKFKLTQCIGIPKEEMLIEPYVKCGKLFAGDIFLLCSDGITDMLALNKIQSIITEQNVPDKIVEELIRQAMAVGGKDNATAICVKAVPSGNLLEKIRSYFRKHF